MYCALTATTSGRWRIKPVTAPATQVAKPATPALEGIGPTPLTRSLTQWGEYHGGSPVNRGDKRVSNMNSPEVQSGARCLTSNARDATKALPSEALIRTA